ncbi:MAG: hypothetical protein PHI37_03195 [Candidatus Gracilibacteria bacterium]|nr:hypothetical protein [Candidatus Gracilibacteria bacterium]
MSNRLIGILIVFSFGVFGFIYWTYFYIPSKIEEKQRQEQIALEQKKEIKLVEIKELEKENEIKELTPQEKIEELKRINSFYKIIEIETDVFYFSKKDNILEVKLGEKIVGNFDLVPVDKLSISRVYSSGDDYYILNGNKKYIYNSVSDLLIELDLTIDIDYIKRSENLYIIKTQKGSFIFDRNTKTLEYFTFFDDFVYYKDFYIGIIKKDDERRLKNLSISSIKGNSIFKYNPKTKEKKSLYETNLDLEKIYNLGDEIYFIDSNSKTYKLENLDQ